MNLADVTRVVLFLSSVVVRGSSVEKNTTDETGYSLVEVMASVTILAIAIIPMVGMFDMGLKAATTSGDYDKARSLANMVLEQAKSLPYQEVRDGSPEAAPVPNGEDFAGFEYEVEKQFLKRPLTGSSTDPTPPAQNFTESTEDEGLIKLTVTIRWGDGKTYTATGLVTDGL